MASLRPAWGIYSVPGQWALQGETLSQKTYGDGKKSQEKDPFTWGNESMTDFISTFFRVVRKAATSNVKGCLKGSCALCEGPGQDPKRLL